LASSRALNFLEIAQNNLREMVFRALSPQAVAIALLPLLTWSLVVPGTMVQPRGQSSEPVQNSELLNETVASRRSLEGISVHDWEDVTKEIIGQTTKFGGKPFEIYGKFADTTFTIIDAIRNQEDWGSAILRVSQSLLPLISTVNPVLSFGLGLFMSIFGFGGGKVSDALNKALDDLHSQIIKEVGDMIVAQAEFRETSLASQFLSKAMTDLKDNPLYVQNSTVELLPTRISFWSEREQQFSGLGPFVFSETCVNPKFSGRRPGKLDPVCKAFQKSGMISMQVPYVMTHLNMLLEIGRLTTDIQRGSVQTRIREHAGIYHELIEDSYNNYRKYASEVIQCNVKPSEYCDGKKRAKCLTREILRCKDDKDCWRYSECWKCYVEQKSDYTHDPHGVDMAQAQRCASKGYISSYTTKTNSKKVSATIDVCKGKNIWNWRSAYPYDHYGRPCTDKDYDAHKTAWLDQVKENYDPILKNLTRISKKD